MSVTVARLRADVKREAKAAVAARPAVGVLQPAAGGHEVAGQEVDGSFELVVGEHLVRLALAVEGREVEGVEGVLGDDLDAAEEAVERAEAAHAAPDGAGLVRRREAGEVRLGVAAGDVGVGQPALVEERPEVGEVGPVRPLGVGAAGPGVAGPPDEQFDGPLEAGGGRRGRRSALGRGGGGGRWEGRVHGSRWGPRSPGMWQQLESCCHKGRPFGSPTQPAGGAARLSADAGRRLADQRGCRDGGLVPVYPKPRPPPIRLGFAARGTIFFCACRDNIHYHDAFSGRIRRSVGIDPSESLGSIWAEWGGAVSLAARVRRAGGNGSTASVEGGGGRL